MKILLGGYRFFPCPPRGTEILTLELARGLRQRGHIVEVLAGAGDSDRRESSPPWLARDDYDGFVVHRLHYGTAKKHDPISHHLMSLDRIALVQKVIAHFCPDVVQFNRLAGFSGHVIPAIRHMGIPVVIVPTDFWLICPKGTLLRTFDRAVCRGPGDAVNCVRCLKPMPRWAARVALRLGATPLRRLHPGARSLDALRRRVKVLVDCANLADRVLPATRFLAEVLIRHGVEARRVKVVPYGVEVGALPEKIPIPLEFSKVTPLQLGFIGDLAEPKGPHVLLEALGGLDTDQRDQLRLDIYGSLTEDEAYHRRLQRQARAVGPQVSFRGVFNHRDIGAVLRSLHVLVIPSLWYESTPLVLCSALAAGTPVLVSRLGGIMEGVTEGVHGFSFPAGDARQLKLIIADLLNSPARLRTVRDSYEPRNRSMLDYVDDIEAEYFRLVTRHPDVETAGMLRLRCA